jgi:NYN domain
MHQIAVFVDAGYLLAAGANLVSGSPVPRSRTLIDPLKIVAALAEQAKIAAPESRLLRIYWYDGIGLYAGPSSEQTALGATENVKLRLGTINSRGQQKGVDSLIVTDLIDLARNKAITDALIVGGDEDLRVGVQVAQTYGVRVALVGVEPSRGNQSFSLLQECDRHFEWTANQIAVFLSVNEDRPPANPNRPQLDQPSEKQLARSDVDEMLEEIIDRFEPLQIEQFSGEVTQVGTIPRQVDAPLLGMARDRLGRDLTDAEKRSVRSVARERLGKA